MFLLVDATMYRVFTVACIALCSFRTNCGYCWCACVCVKGGRVRCNRTRIRAHTTTKKFPRFSIVVLILTSRLK